MKKLVLAIFSVLSFSLSVFIAGAVGKLYDPEDGKGLEPHMYLDPRDGMQYPIISIDSLWWLNRNLAFNSPYSNVIAQDTSSGVKGRVYSFEEAQIVCPPGWRLPTTAEFDHLLQKMSGNHNAFGIAELEYNWHNIDSNASGFHIDKTGFLHKKKWKSMHSFNIWLDHPNKEEAYHVHLYDVSKKDNSDVLTAFRHTHEKHAPIKMKRKFAVRCVCERRKNE